VLGVRDHVEQDLLERARVAEHPTRHDSAEREDHRDHRRDDGTAYGGDGNVARRARRVRDVVLLPAERLALEIDDVTEDEPDGVHDAHAVPSANDRKGPVGVPSLPGRDRAAQFRDLAIDEAGASPTRRCCAASSAVMSHSR